MSTEESNLPTRTVCPACGGRVKIPPGQTGQQLRCPRCNADLFPIAPPLAEETDALSPPEAPESDEYRLSDVVQRPQLADIHERLLTAAEHPGDRDRDGPGDKRVAKPLGGDVLAAAARDVLGRAETEVEQAEQEAAARYVIRPLFSGLFSFLGDIHAAGRWIALTLILTGCTACVHLFVTLSGGGPIQQFTAILVGMAVALLGLSYLALASVCWLAIVQDTAIGLDRIEQWPGPNFLDWIFDSFYLWSSLFLSLLPGVLLGYMRGAGGTGVSAVATVLGLILAFGLFPIMLLSALDSGTPLGVWSNSLVGNLIRHKSTTKRFFLGAAVLAAGALVSLVFAVQPWFLVSLFGAVAFNAIAMIYFRLLGRLAGLLGSDQPDDACSQG
jgi:hypothetical protein